MVMPLNRTVGAVAIVGAMAAIALPSTAHAEFLGLSADLVGFNLVQAVPGQPDYPDTWTCRIYADFNAGDHLTSVYGDSSNYMLFAADSQFYQNAFGGPTSQDIDASQYDALPDLRYDSWLTIGAESMTDNTLGDVGISWSAFNTGSPLYVNNGALFITPDDDQGIAQLDGSGHHRVLVAQLTIFGNMNTKVWGQANLLWGDASTGEMVSSFVEFSFANIPAPGAVSVLGLAALFSGHRRRRNITC